MTMTARTRLGLRVAVAAVTLATALVATAPAAQANHTRCYHARVGTVQAVCATDLAFRTDCDTKAWSGWLYTGDRTYVAADYGDWVRVYSYKHNRWGCVQDGWFYLP